MSDFRAIMPILIVTLTAAATMVAEAFRKPGEDMPLAGLGFIGLFGAAIASVLLWNRNLTGFGVILADNFALFVFLVLAIVGILTIMFSSGVVERENIPAGEYYALSLFALAGMMLMASATDLLVVFISLEILSLAVYVLTGIRRTDPIGTEASFKYFLLGAFSSAFFLYGVAFTYVVAGSTRLAVVTERYAAGAVAGEPLAWLGMLLLLVGFLFKVSAVPFHMWTPDAYEGAPTLVTGFMSTGVKAAAFAAFLRIFLGGFEPMHAQWSVIVAWVAVATMIIGTVVGIAQSNVKRMLAYSSIAHAGYLLVGLVAATAVGQSAVLFYLLAYSVTNLGAFGVVAVIATRERPYGDLRDFAGLWYSRPALAGLMTLFLLSLGGFPPTAGFWGKWYIFTAAVQEGHYWLAIIGVLTSVISVFYYLRIVVMMYMSETKAAFEPAPLSGTGLAGLVLAGIGVLYLGILPSDIIELATRSVTNLF
jgi:NADH-quinone oxidoreductase subunit N